MFENEREIVGGLRRGRGVLRQLGRGGLGGMLVVGLLAGGCGFGGGDSEAKEPADQAEKGGRGGAPGMGGPGGFGASSGGQASTAIPVKVEPAGRRSIAQFLETNGALEAEYDVALVARASGPVIELLTEEGKKVEKGQLLARLESDAIRAQLEIAKVALGEAQLNYDRAKRSYEAELIPREMFDLAKSRLDSAEAQLHGNQVQLDYTEVRAPFGGLIIERFIKFAETVQVGAPLFRIADFDPLQCPIQVPEKDLSRMKLGQSAFVQVEAFPGERFPARVLRISPIVSAVTGTVKVTLEVSTQSKLSPGMFASVFLETDRHQNALVISKAALVLESIGDTVYIKKGDVAARREVILGYDEGNAVEVVSGIEEGDEVIVLGQDSLTDGTPVYVLDPAAPRSAGTSTAGQGSSEGQGPSNGAPLAGRPGGGGMPDPASMTPERIKAMKERMRGMGLTDAQIDQRIEAMKSGRMPAGRPPGS